MALAALVVLVVREVLVDLVVHSFLGSLLVPYLLVVPCILVLQVVQELLDILGVLELVVEEGMEVVVVVGMVFVS